jgi:cold shock CspA family protein
MAKRRNEYADQGAVVKLKPAQRKLLSRLAHAIDHAVRHQWPEGHPEHEITRDADGFWCYIGLTKVHHSTVAALYGTGAIELTDGSDDCIHVFTITAKGRQLLQEAENVERTADAGQGAVDADAVAVAPAGGA